MTLEPDIWAPVRCPEGCDPRFILYLNYEDAPNLRRADITREEQVPGTIQRRKFWTLGLRCSDCAKRYVAKNVPDETKKAIDDSIYAGMLEMKDLNAQLTREENDVQPS